MKLINTTLLFLAMALFFSSCKDDDNLELKNLPPGEFALSDQNFFVMYNQATSSVAIDWPNVIDPDGDKVTYELQIDGNSIQTNLTLSETSVPIATFEDLYKPYTFKIIASDELGATSESSMLKTLTDNQPPSSASNLVTQPSFYGAKLRWQEATDPNDNLVYYTININGQAYATDIEGNQFIIKDIAEETAISGELIAIDEFGAASEPIAINFTTLKKETIASATVKVKVWGIVVDETSKAIENAEITVGGKKTKTNNLGLFVINEVEIDQDRGALKATNQNYFDAFRTIKAIDGEASFLRIEMLPKTVIGKINALAGGEVTAQTGMKIELPKEAFEDYQGEVTLVSSLMDPTNPEFGAQNPSLESFNAAGEYGALRSFGMAAIELQDENGNEIHLQTGKQATLTFPVPADLGEFAPKEIPLWSFDETQNIWIEEGSAELINGEYVGKVGHFSLWNCDDFRRGRNVCFTIQDANGNAATNAFIEITLENGMVASGYTNASGEVCTFMPSDISFTINVSISGGISYNSNGYRQCNLITGQKGNGVPFGTTRISRIVKAQGGQELYVSVEGKVEDCDNKALANSLVVIRDKQENMIISGFSKDDGTFLLQGLHCFPFEGNESNRIDVVAYDFINNKYSKAKEFAVVSNRIIVNEPFKTCEESIPPFVVGSSLFEGNLVIDSNQDVTDFVEAGYTGVNGDLQITGAEVTDISGFAGRLLTLTGDLRIRTTNLTTINSLKSISTLRTLQIDTNSKLTAIDLSGLVEITGASFSIFSNSKLTELKLNIDLTGPSITSISIRNNPLLESDIINNGFTELRSLNFSGSRTNANRSIAIEFNNLEKVASIGNVATIGLENASKIKHIKFPKLKECLGRIVIVGVEEEVDFNALETLRHGFTLFNTLVTDFDLPNLTTFTDDENFLFSNNDNLRHLDGFDKLTGEVGGFHAISNKNLVSINGFNNVNAIDDVIINTNNELLEIAGFMKTQGEVSRVTDGAKRYSFRGNAKLKSITGFQNETHLVSLVIDDNPKLTTITGFKNATVIDFFVFDNNDAMVHLDTFANLTGDLSSSFTIENCENLETTPNFNKITSVLLINLRNLFKLTKVPDFTGLVAVSAGGSPIDISRLNAITDINGFNNLPSTAAISIFDCENLLKITGFQKLASIEKNVRIYRNTKLKDYCGIPSATWNTNQTFQIFEIIDNSYNPTQAQLFNGICSK